MGLKLTIGDHRFFPTEFSLVEDATPLAASDTTGSVGSFTLTLPEPDAHAVDLEDPDSGMAFLARFGHNALLDQPVSISDSERGHTLGVVAEASFRVGGGIRLTCISKLGELNVYNVQAQPFVGTLGNAFRYYLGLVGLSANVTVDPFLNTRPVVYVGWHGELWYHLKMICQAEAAEVALVDGNIVFRPIRRRVATAGREIQRSAESPAPTLAQAIEAYKYNTAPITNELVYPPGGWTPEVEVLNVNAGETAEYTLELSASVSSIQAPVCATQVNPQHSSSSIYSVVANDGIEVQPAEWTAKGGRVDVTINQDTMTLKVVLKGAVGVGVRGGAAATHFSLALGSASSGNRYSTLRIVGTGVSFDKQKKRIRTGIPASRTSTEVGVTIDNPFLSSTEQLYRAGIPAAVQYSGTQPTFSTEVLDAVDEGESMYGNVNGSRIFDRRTRRWYRVRSATINPGGISVQGDDDLTHGDIEEQYVGRTYAEVQALREGLTYFRERLAGIL